MRQTASKSSNKLKASLLIVFLLLIVLSVIIYQQLHKVTLADPEYDSELRVPELAVAPVDLVMPHKIKNTEVMSEIDLMVAELSGRLHRQYKDNIHLIVIQVGLKSLRNNLSRLYRGQGNELFLQILNNAFPEWVDTILKAIALMDEYDNWLEHMLVSLNDMNDLEQQGVIWDKRRSLFGDDATQIWQEEISADQNRHISMRQTMEMLDKSYEIQMQERLFLFQSAFEEAYADKLQSMVIDPKGVLSQVFFGFDAVQRDLSALPPGVRQARIDQLRQLMGYPDDQIKSLSQSDLKREQRWQNGYAYMDARKTAESTFTGDELDKELDNIREKFFAHEASTIKKEEEELAFYRYKRPRVYGRN